MEDMYRVYKSSGRLLKKYARPGDVTLFIKTHLPTSESYKIVCIFKSPYAMKRVKITALDWLDGRRPEIG